MKDKSSTTFAKELIIDAVEKREDMALSSIAKQREDNNTGPLISHDDAWK